MSHVPNFEVLRLGGTPYPIQHRISGRTLFVADVTGKRLPKNVGLRRAIIWASEHEVFDFQHADLAGADLSKIWLHGLDLRDADLSNADLTEAALWNCNLIGATFRGANLVGVEFSNCEMTGGEFTGARFG